MADDTTTLDTADAVPVRIRDDKGRFLPAAGGKNGIGGLITAENAGGLARRRWEKARNAAAERVRAELATFDPAAADAAVNGSGYTVNDAWGMLVAKTAAAIINSDTPRGDDLARVGQCMGVLPRADELAAAHGAGQAAGTVASIAALQSLIDALGRAGQEEQDEDV